ncbi:hypothetical protein ACQQ7F_08095 [Corynebacterium diphtheriae]
MSVFRDSRELREIYLGGRAIKEIYKGKRLVWSGRDQAMKGFECFFSVAEFSSRSISGAWVQYRKNTASWQRTVTTPDSSRTADFYFLAKEGSSLSMTLKGRNIFTFELKNGRLKTSSDGDYAAKMRTDDAYSTSEYRLVRVQFFTSWYGYSYQVDVAGEKIASENNGGGFTRGENWIIPGNVEFSATNIPILAFFGGSTDLGARMGRSSAFAGTTISGWWKPIDFLFPPKVQRQWIVGGGGGGQGGSDNYDGAIGPNGKVLQLPNNLPAGTLSIGTGGQGGRDYWNGGKMGEEGNPTTFGGYSTASSSTRLPSYLADLHPALRSGGLSKSEYWSIKDIGKGGSGGDRKSDSRYAESGDRGRPGGLITVYEW